MQKMEKNAEKRPAEEHQSLLHDAKAILTEAEGTTTPLSFVKVYFMAKCFSGVMVASPTKNIGVTPFSLIMQP